MTRASYPRGWGYNQDHGPKPQIPKGSVFLGLGLGFTVTCLTCN